MQDPNWLPPISASTSLAELMKHEAVVPASPAPRPSPPVVRGREDTMAHQPTRGLSRVTQPVTSNFQEEDFIGDTPDSPKSPTVPLLEPESPGDGEPTWKAPNPEQGRQEPLLSAQAAQGNVLETTVL